MSVDSVSSKKGKINSSGKLVGDEKSPTPINTVLQMGQSQLLEPSQAYWSNPDINQAERKTFIDGLQTAYQSILLEFINTADACVDQTNFFEKVNQKWRWIVILGTGVVAIVNILAANLVTADPIGNSDTPAIFLSVTAAVAASILAVLANLENFTGAPRRAQGFRQARERFLDASREYEQLWNTYVNPFYPKAEACMNSIILMRMLVEKDQELRDRLVELTKIKGQET